MLLCVCVLLFVYMCFGCFAFDLMCDAVWFVCFALLWCLCVSSLNVILLFCDLLSDVLWCVFVLCIVVAESF